MDFVPLIVITALVLSLFNLIKLVRAQSYGEALTQLFSWLAGVGVMFLLRASDWADTFIIGQGDDARVLSTLSAPSVVLAGIALAAVANVAYSALPNTETPSLFPNMGSTSSPTPASGTGSDSNTSNPDLI